MMLEAGATEAQVSAVTGQSPQMVAYYAKRVNNERLSAEAVLKWEAESTRLGHTIDASCKK